MFPHLSKSLVYPTLAMRTAGESGPNLSESKLGMPSFCFTIKQKAHKKLTIKHNGDFVFNSKT